MSYKEKCSKELLELGFTVIESAFTTVQASIYRDQIQNYFKDGKNACTGIWGKSQTIKSNAINDPYFTDFLDIYGNKKLLEVLHNTSKSF